MNTSFLKKLCCPQDKQDLELTVFAKTPVGDITEGLLTCPECRRYYPIVYGIPIMTPDEYREKALEAPLLKKWGLRLEENESKFLLTE
ncbi:MAG: Trm112 family protein [Fulvivirga sp.]